MNNKKLWMNITIILLILSAGSLSAEDRVTVDLRLDKNTASVGQSLLLILDVQGEDAVVPPTLASTDAYDLSFRGGGPQNSTSIVSVNGRTTRNVQKRYQAQWLLKPKKAGRYRLGPFEFAVGGKTYQSQALNLQIDPPLAVSGYLLTEELTPARCFPGLPVHYRVKWYFSESVRDPSLSLPLLESPDFQVIEQSLQPPAGADVFEVTAGNRKIPGVKSASILDGKQYTTLEFNVDLIPLKQGEFALGPAVVSFEGAVRYTKSEDFFGHETNTPVFGSFAIPSKGLRFAVQGLPEAGRPDPFSGLVGKIDLKSSVNGQTYHVGDPIEFTLELQGALNLKNIDLSRLVKAAFSSELWRVGDEEKLGDSKSRWILRALTPAVDRIPELRINYFDPQRESYALAAAPAISLTIQGSPTLSLLPSSGTQASTPLSKGGVPFSLGPSADRPLSFPWIVLLIPAPLVFLGCVLLGRRKHSSARYLKAQWQLLADLLRRLDPSKGRLDLKNSYEALKNLRLTASEVAAFRDQIVDTLAPPLFSGSQDPVALDWQNYIDEVVNRGGLKK